MNRPHSSGPRGGREPLTRAFVAVFPPRPVVDALAAAVGALRLPGDGVSWVKPGNVHYTLRFLGEIPPGRVEAARRAVAAAVVGLAPFHVRLGGAGCFPNGRRPRVLWLGAREGDAELRVLARSLDVALEREGFGRPDRPFEPHLTLGRVREEADGAAVGERFQGAAFPEAGFDVAELVLVRSTLDPRGSIYQPLAAARLTPGPAGPAGNSVPGEG